MGNERVHDFIGEALILWATIDPIGTLALFAGLTAKQSAAHRQKTAFKAIFYSGAILFGAILVGQWILDHMGIRLISLQVAGGTILFLFGLQMIFGSGTMEEGLGKESGHDIAVFPLAVPSIASPGAILAVILLTDNKVYPLSDQMGTAAILFIILAITLAFMLWAGAILKVIGHNGAAVLVKIMGVLLAALSIELVMEALGIPQWVDPPG